jgi:N-acetyl-1-D-myo-inositol-2-amino-2-deoxy-alpha-D-glucopyranoside deacetylase/mycothiol S-conjugate amidase
MPNQRTLMFVGAHPDDESFGPGGTLAKYAGDGVRVVYACATRGEAGGSDGDGAREQSELAERRWSELRCAAQALGISDVLHLGYRDSGMAGAPDNDHPRALIAAPPEEVARDVVAVIRQVRPQVIITFDPIGGYYHPDHIAMHHATALAFHQAGRADHFPGLGAPWRPSKLYYWVPSRTLLRLAVRGLRLLGRDPSQTGRNHDVDLTRIAAVEFPVHTRIRLSRRILARKHAAGACHRSQLAPVSAARRMARVLSRYLGSTELFTLAHPQPWNGLSEADLFDGVATAKDSP